MTLTECRRQEFDRLKTSIPAQKKMIRNLKDHYPAKKLERFLVHEKRRFDQLRSLFENS